jgi:hypothetical protein
MFISIIDNETKQKLYQSLLRLLLKW